MCDANVSNPANSKILYEFIMNKLADSLMLMNSRSTGMYYKKLNMNLAKLMLILLVHYAYVCVHLCVYTYTCACMCAYTSVCMSVFITTSLSACMHAA